MVVQHNMQAMNANRMLNVTTSTQAKSTEKLSSGYKINRAADDAAGLTISEKMRKQIKGLDQASTNAEDGVSAVQTAEGALTEVHSMLQRMNELAVQASNGTNSESDRSAIQDEISQLTTEIDRVSETTKFNETYLLKGNVDGTSSDKYVNAHDAGLDGKLVDNGKTATFKVGSDLKDGDKITIAGKEYTIGSDGSNKTSTDTYGDAATIGAKTMGIGDSFTDKSSGITYNVVGKVANDAAVYEDGKSAFTITHKDGSVSSYDVSSTAGAGKVNKADAFALIKAELEAGSTVTMTKDKTGASVDYEVVAALQTTGKNQEISYAALTTGQTAADVAGAAPGGAVTLTAGDTVTIGGVENTVTANEPKLSSDISDVVNELVKGDSVAITRGGTTTTLTVGDTTDAIKGTYTISDILSNIKDGDQIGFTISATNTDGTAMATSKGIAVVTTGAPTTKYTVVGNATNQSDDSVITKADALEKIASELQKASSIGTDTEAKVTNNGNGEFTIQKGTVDVKDSLSFNLHVGADADMTNKINVEIDSMSAAGLGIKGLNVKDKTGTAATYAIDAIADAVAKVSAQRSSLGAVQNRLEHTIANVDNVVENTTSAESRIRDTDMAEEMVNYSKNNILAQAGQSMLAQANQSNQGVLSLLQ